MRYEQVADEVFVIRGTDVNMFLLREGRDLTLIDAGWYGDAQIIEHTVEALGHQPRDIKAVLLTHAHLDHVGALNHLQSRYGIPAYTSATEVGHAKGEFHEAATPLDVIKRLGDYSTCCWALRITRAGALRKNVVPHIQPFPTDGPLDLPGKPTPIPTPGHTSGHTAYFLPEVGAIATGDTLVTAHPTSKHQGPQLLPRFFHHSTEKTLKALTALSTLPANLLLPGHGPTLSQPIATAVSAATTHATTTLT